MSQVFIQFYLCENGWGGGGGKGKNKQQVFIEFHLCENEGKKLTINEHK